jgi:hypothetical protein
MEPKYVPDIKKDNYDNNHVNNKAWNDTEEINEHHEILKRAS